MGFKEAEETSSLLNCLVCQKGFGLASIYCGECGAHRSVALGIERERTAPRPTATSKPSTPDSHSSAPTVNDSPAFEKGSTGKLNFLEKISNWLLERSRLVTSLGTIATVISLYFVAQTIAYINSDPSTQVDSYIKAVAVHDSQYFNSPVLTPNLNTVPFLPSQYNQWPEAAETSWIRTIYWNGWSKSATSVLSPGNSTNSLNLDLVGSAKAGSFGIFKQISWAVKGPMATLEIRYPISKNLPIYINGISAGTTLKPAVAQGTYYVFPGPIVFTFGDPALDINKFTVDIGTSGHFTIPQ
jgi:hypothetical protein